MSRILVIGGGISDERDVSLRSAHSVFDAIDVKHTKYFYDWDGNEQWLLENANNYDVALPVLHGIGGEDGQIQALLERAGIKYLGSGVEVSEICIDKEKTQSALGASGIPIPKQAVVSQNDYLENPLTQGPHVLKPVSGGSSIDTFVIKTGHLDDENIESVFSRHPKLILEECIIGPEITVPVLQGYSLPVIEIIPGKEFFDFESKYDGSSQEICNSENISQEIQKNAQDLARKCHEALGCRHLSRVDIMLDKDNNPFVIEVNTMPGLTDQSLFPKAAAYVGLSMPQLVEHFINLSLES